MSKVFSNCWIELQLDTGLHVHVNYDFDPGVHPSLTEDGYPAEIYLWDLRFNTEEMKALGLTPEYIDKIDTIEEIYRKITEEEEAALYRDDSGAYPEADDEYDF